MKSARWPTTAGMLVVALAVIILLPATNVLLLFSPALVSYEYSRPDFPASAIYDPASRLALAQDTVRYINAGNPGSLLRQMRYNGQPVYNEREVQHLVDVRTVLDGLTWAWRVALVIVLLGLLVALWKPFWRRPLARGSWWGGIMLVAVLLGILISAFLSFDWFFIRFHRVFFSGDSWLFSWDDSLIQFYPVELWMDATYMLGTATLIEGLLVAGLSYFYLWRKNRLARKAG